jgi:hypothetical protein
LLEKIMAGLKAKGVIDLYRLLTAGNVLFRPAVKTAATVRASLFPFRAVLETHREIGFHNDV